MAQVTDMMEIVLVIMPSQDVRALTRVRGFMSQLMRNVRAGLESLYFLVHERERNVGGCARSGHALH